MTYAVMTTKHHDGWTLFPSTHSSYGVTQTLGGRYLVAEYVQACPRRRPAGWALLLPRRSATSPGLSGLGPTTGSYTFINLARSSPEAGPFPADMEGQLRHLLTAYGTIDLLWFDGGWERSADEWESADLAAMIYGLQPGIVLNDRLPVCRAMSRPSRRCPRRRRARRGRPASRWARAGGWSMTTIGSPRRSCCSRWSRWRAGAAACCSTSPRMAKGAWPRGSASGSR